MTRRRFAALALALATFAGCHEDPNVQQVVVPGAATALTIFTDGGTAATQGNAAGTGKDAGKITATAIGDLNLGGSTTLTNPTVPPVPAATAPVGSVTGGFTGSGSVLISGNVSLAPAATVTFESLNGDLVITGTIKTTDVGVTQAHIDLKALNGTVYISGSVLTTSSDGNPTGDQGGSIDITAQRIVITGTIDTHGEASATIGGIGGAVSMTTSANGQILVTGSVLTSGGTGTTGGQAGIINLNAAGPLKVFGPLTADGGEATDTTVGTPVGGAANDITLSSGSDMDISTTISLRGGSAKGGSLGGNGGDGHVLTLNAGNVKVYGTIDTRGGTPTATAIGVGTMNGGQGGNITITSTTLEMGRGTWTTIGGSGVNGVGNGGAIDLQTVDGLITLGSDLDSHGGKALGTSAPPATQGGKGGDVTIKGDTTASSSVPHSLTVLSVASVTTTGGGGSAAGNGGNGGAVTVQTGGDITLPIAIVTSGGTSVDGTGGQGGAINVIQQRNGGGGSGDVLMTGVLTATGGVSTNGPGGTGGAVTVDTSAGGGGGASTITCSADINTSGTNGLTGAAAGGAPGTILFATQTGDIALSGTITANGGDSIAAPGSATTITVTAGSSSGDISSTASITASGGKSLAGNAVNVQGGTGCTIKFEALSAIGRIQFSQGSGITADGGTSTGTLGGGPGGTVTVETVGQSVSISGSMIARGGNQNGTGSGGLGGQVLVNTDSDGAGMGGDITLNSNGSIDVSSGTGSGGGDARNNGGTVDPVGNPGLIAVIFDAGGDLGTSPDGANEGIVLNLGTITARGRGSNGDGGDVYFDGKQASGGDPVGGTQNLTGTGGVTGTFKPD
jgi:hypothetical protein